MIDMTRRAGTYIQDVVMVIARVERSGEGESGHVTIDGGLLQLEVLLGVDVQVPVLVRPPVLKPRNERCCCCCIVLY